MNRAFIAKMIAAKRLECEAMRELLPETLKSSLDELGKCLKEVYISQEFHFSRETSKKDTEKKEAKGEQKVRKVTIE